MGNSRSLRWTQRHYRVFNLSLIKIASTMGYRNDFVDKASMWNSKIIGNDWTNMATNRSHQSLTFTRLDMDTGNKLRNLRSSTTWRFEVDECMTRESSVWQNYVSASLRRIETGYPPRHVWIWTVLPQQRTISRVTTALSYLFHLTHWFDRDTTFVWLITWDTQPYSQIWSRSIG